MRAQLGKSSLSMETAAPEGMVFGDEALHGEPYEFTALCDGRKTKVLNKRAYVRLRTHGCAYVSNMRRVFV